MLAKLLRLVFATLLIGCLDLSSARGHQTHPVEIDWSKASLQSTWRGGLVVSLPMSDPVPYGLTMAENPPRLGVRLLAPAIAVNEEDRPSGLTLSPTFEGSILWVDLPKPLLLRSSELTKHGNGALLRLLLDKTSAEEFQSAMARSQSDRTLPPPRMTRPNEGVFHVMLDPGHGGFDPGAQHGGIREADLVLSFAQELRDALVAAGLSVSLTREHDRFVPLATRVALAAQVRADVFVSLHADALEVGRASGASVHTLPEEAEDAADAFLLNQLGDEALATTSGPTDDTTTAALMDLARRSTRADSAKLADVVIEELETGGITLYKSPTKQSNFVVLRAADVPSILVELGFLSEPEDRARLVDPAWRAKMARALTQALVVWSQTAPE